MKVHAFLISNTFFSTQPKCCLTFSWIELQMLLKCCLIHVNIVILSHFLLLLCLSPYLELGLFMSNLCNLCGIFIFIFINENVDKNYKSDTLVLLLIFKNISYYSLLIKLMKNANNSQMSKFSLRVLLSICLMFCQFQPGAVYKSIASLKQACNRHSSTTEIHMGLLMF